MARQRESKYKFTYRRTNKLTPDTIRKLEEAAGVRLDVKASCAYAGISRDTYYQWMKKVKGLADRLDDLRQNPIIRAKRRIISQLDNDTNVAFRFLEKESPEEYGEKLKLEHSGQIDNAPGAAMNPELAALQAEYHERARKLRLKRYEEKEKAPKT